MPTVDGNFSAVHQEGKSFDEYNEIQRERRLRGLLPELRFSVNQSGMDFILFCYCGDEI